MGELKPCPFCGHPAEHNNVNGNKLVKCTNQYCINTICTWPERVWNTRPIEDALQARIAELEASLKTGWQLYEPEPPREPEYVICKRCAGSQSVHNPEVSNTAYTTCPKCGGTGYEIEPEPAFKAGDWVEYSDGTLQQAIIEAYSGQPGEQMVYVWHPQTAHSAKTPLQSITRKLDPSEVVVKIGCLSGTIKQSSDPAAFILMPICKDGGLVVPSIIAKDMLDAPTREMVESLLKAQEVNNG
jgi:hypothetical protein